MGLHVTIIELETHRLEFTIFLVIGELMDDGITLGILKEELVSSKDDADFGDLHINGVAEDNEGCGVNCKELRDIFIEFFVKVRETFDIVVELDVVGFTELLDEVQSIISFMSNRESINLKELVELECCI